MKRVLVLFVVLGMVVGSLTAAEAAKKKKKKKPAARVVTANYAPASDGGLIIFRLGTAPGVSLTQVPFTPTAKERKVSIAITDDSGQPVRASLAQSESELSDFCGKTDAPVMIAPGVEIQLKLFSGTCGSGVGVMTQGKITATFSQ